MNKYNNEALFQDILVPSLGNVNDSVAHIANMPTWAEKYNLRSWVRRSCAVQLKLIRSIKFCRHKKDKFV